MDHHQAAKRMQLAFATSPDLWLSETQIQGYFSRFSANLNKKRYILVPSIFAIIDKFF